MQLKKAEKKDVLKNYWQERRNNSYQIRVGQEIYDKKEEIKYTRVGPKYI